MYTSVILVLAFVCGSLALSPVPPKCPGGFSEGANVEQGRFWYTCTSGNLVMKGCLSDTKSHMNEHDTIKKDGFLLECALGTGGDFIFKYKACLSEAGVVVNPGDTWQDDNYWYMCSTDGDRLKADVKGCCDAGKRYNIGESVPKSDLIYECSHNANGNTGWDIYPNHGAGVSYNPNEVHVQNIQNVPRP